jgi:ribose 5-phosphate isomerase B
MKIVIASDHAGFDLKSEVVAHLKSKNINVLDLGPDTEKVSVDYPDYAKKVAEAVLAEDCLGILICGTGIGMSISANKFKGIRAALVGDTYSAKMTKRHNNANIICMGSRVIGTGLAIDMVDTWLNESFEGGRHQARLSKIS